VEVLYAVVSDLELGRLGSAVLSIIFQSAVCERDCCLGRSEHVWCRQCCI